jgi:hypothetical protein
MDKIKYTYIEHNITYVCKSFYSTPVSHLIDGLEFVQFGFDVLELVDDEAEAVTEALVSVRCA